MSDTSATALIALDWGTTSARAYRMARDGAVQDRRSAPLGILQVRDGAFAPALAALLGDWAGLDAPRLACGMIGSRQGWVEAPYTKCPADLAAVARALVRSPGGEIAIVGGLAWRDEHATPDVMRGEETQIAGLADEALDAALVVQPGTHSKWTVASRGAITAFATYMTGELYAVLREHSILGRLMEQGTFDPAAYAHGVDAGLRAQPGELPHALFAARTLPLFGDLTPSGAADYLSGLLIGSEIAHGRAWAAARGAPLVPWLVGDPALCARYEAAFTQAGMATRAGPADASARGLWRFARLAGLV